MERNYHCRWGELDLVAAESDNQIHFVDVPGTMTIPYNRVVISARNRLTPQYMGFL